MAKRKIRFFVLLACLIAPVPAILCAAGTPTTTPTPVGIPPSVTVSVYDVNGALVCVLAQEDYTNPPSGVYVQPAAAPGCTMVQLPGMLPAPQPIGWCGSDSLGHPVPAGLYYIRVSIVDAGGSTQTTVTQVSNPGGCVTVTVYDASTGAKVLALYSGSYTSAPRAMTVDNTAFSIPGAVSVGLPGMVPAAPAIQWNGKGTNGQSVPAGDYTVRAEWKPLVYGETAQGQTLVKVLPSALGLGHAVLAPVPVRGGQPLCLYFAQPALASHWDVYAITGALVAHLDFGAGGQQCWDTAGIAPGIYFVRLVIDDAGGGKETRWQKVALH